MSRLFAQIALGLLVALLIASGLASQVLRVQLDRGKGGLAPNPVQRECNLVQWSLSKIDGPEQLIRIQELKKEFPVKMQLVPNNQLPRNVQNLLHGSSPVFQLFHKQKKVYIRLGDENGTLVLGPYRHNTPFRPTQLLWVFGIILPIVGIAAYLLAAPMVRRLRELEKVSQEIGQGNLNARVNFEAKDATGDLARQFNRMAERIEGLLESQKHLLGAVSHELRTPISRIEFLLEALQSTDDQDHRDLRVEEIRKEMGELSELVGELLTFTCFDSLSEAPVREMIFVQPLIEEAVTRVKHCFSGREVTVEVDLPPGLQFSLNRNNFRRVVDNLVSNAVKYSRDVVWVHCREEVDYLCLVVDDDGPGIGVEDRQAIFEPFFRLDEARSRESGGAGLGLAIVSRILESHGGSIDVSQAPLGGARLVARWPRK